MAGYLVALQSAYIENWAVDDPNVRAWVEGNRPIECSTADLGGWLASWGPLGVP